jgi:hypothetical protein
MHRVQAAEDGNERTHDRVTFAAPRLVGAFQLGEHLREELVFDMEPFSGAILGQADASIVGGQLLGRQAFLAAALATDLWGKAPDVQAGAHYVSRPFRYPPVFRIDPVVGFRCSSFSLGYGLSIYSGMSVI